MPYVKRRRPAEAAGVTTVRITDREATKDPARAAQKALAARARGDLVEVPWWFYLMAMSHPRFRRAHGFAERTEHEPARP